MSALLIMTLINDETRQARSLPVERWRLISAFDLAGPVNMGMDEVLLESVIGGGAPAVRFYSWRPATLSLGVNQHVGEIDRTECEALGFGLVRRITGGRAVLHQHELTYSVVARENDPRVSGGVIESYRKISEALVQGLAALGAKVSLASPDRVTYSSLSPVPRLEESGETAYDAVCFSAASAYELTANGRKLVGSAQARRGGAILQHGSVLLDIDWDAWVSVFAYASEVGKERARAKLPSRMTSLKEELGREVSIEKVCAALTRGFEEALNIGLEPVPLDKEERAMAERLAREKFGSEEWTSRS